MNNETKEPMEELIRGAARTIEPRYEFSDELWTKMEMNTKHKQPYTGKPRFMRPAWGLSFAALAIAITCAAYGPQNVLAAVRTLIGYIPGIGFVVQDDSTLYLEKPVSVTQDGVTLTVEQAVADANGIVVSFHIDGLPEPKPGEIYTCMYADNRLRLPDGKELLPTGGGITGNQARIEFAHEEISQIISSNTTRNSGTQARIEFSSPPAGVKQVTLISHGEADCPAPINWSIDIPLGKVAPQPALPVINVTAVSTPSSRAESKSPTIEAGSAPTPFNNKIHVAVEKTVSLSDGWLVTGHITWDDPDINNMYVPPEGITVTDAAGNQIPVAPTDDGYSDGEFGFYLKQIDIKSPVKMTIANLLINGMMEKGPEFSFDAGKDPKPGDEWKIGRTLEVFGMAVTIEKASLAEFDQGVKGYAVIFTLPVAISNIDMRLVGNGSNRSGFGEGRPLPDHKYELKMGFPQGIPAGKNSFTINNVQWEQKGNWEYSWNIPAK